jgi:hypothetical protein
VVRAGRKVDWDGYFLYTVEVVEFVDYPIACASDLLLAQGPQSLPLLTLRHR